MNVQSDLKWKIEEEKEKYVVKSLAILKTIFIGDKIDRTTALITVSVLMQNYMGNSKH